jgi:cytochrome c oxidase subunit 2
LCWRSPSAVIAGVVLGAAAWANEPHPGNWACRRRLPRSRNGCTRSTTNCCDHHFAITIFVLGLMLYVIVRFSAERHPVPTRTSHNPVIEVLWTVVPVLILVAIAIPSFKLMYLHGPRCPTPT